MERYFDVYEMSEIEKLGAASMGLEGDALAWFQWENKRRSIPNWRSLRRMLLRHFRGRRGGCLMEQWMSVKQEGGVEEYERVFIQFASNLEEEVSEPCLLANFIKGFEWKIQAELRLMDPTNMDEGLDWAVKIEEKLIALGLLHYYNGPGRKLPNHPYQNNTFPRHNPNPINHKNLTPSSSHFPKHNSQNPRNTNTSHLNSNRNFNYDNARRLTDREFQDRKSKGLCYRCDEKWKLGHVCKNRELSVLIVGDSEGDDEQGEEDDEDF